MVKSNFVKAGDLGGQVTTTPLPIHRSLNPILPYSGNVCKKEGHLGHSAESLDTFQLYDAHRKNGNLERT